MGSSGQPRSSAHAPPARTRHSASADTTTWDPDYEVIATRADARAFIQKRPDLFGTDVPLADDDPRSLRGQALLHKHWPAIIAKFHPGFPEQFVFVVDRPQTIGSR